jgi:hypothetical protein
MPSRVYSIPNEHVVAQVNRDFGLSIDDMVDALDTIYTWNSDKTNSFFNDAKINFNAKFNYPEFEIEFCYCIICLKWDKVRLSKYAASCIIPSNDSIDFICPLY